MKNIILVGFMGTGKTRVGKELAARLDMKFVDMDDVIVEREGRSIPDVFSQDGEAYFRDLERKLVQELSAEIGLVIATGGGIVLNQSNIDDFGRTGLVVCLSLSPETILERVEADTNRPLLAGDDKLGKIMGILEKRQPLYDAIPCQVDRNGLEVDGTVEAIISKLDD
jgi:shikimate kinase